MKRAIIRTPKIEEYEIWSKIYKVYLEFYQTSLTEDELKKYGLG